MVGTLEVDDDYVVTFRAAQRAVRYLLLSDNAAAALAMPLIKLAVHDAVTFDENTRTGGPNGSIRVGRELARAENVGLEGAMAALEGVKAKFEAVSYADLIQLAGAVAVEMVGGPLVEMNVGRKDSKACPPSGRVPTAAKGSAAVKAAFERAGLSNVDAAAVLCAVPVGSSTERPTGALALTPLDLGSSYLSKVTSGPAEEAVTELLQQDDDMRVTVLKWQENEDDFLEAFGEAFKKLSEVGCKGLVRPRKGAANRVPKKAKSAAGGGASGDDFATLLEDPYMLLAGAVAAGAAFWWWNRRRKPLAA
jgi:L-ascorbate peroxidase